jgi:hypothetical protein
MPESAEHRETREREEQLAKIRAQGAEYGEWMRLRNEELAALASGFQKGMHPHGIEAPDEPTNPPWWFTLLLSGRYLMFGLVLVSAFFYAGSYALFRLWGWVTIPGCCLVAFLYPSVAVRAYAYFKLRELEQERAVDLPPELLAQLPVQGPFPE